ncbi:MAG: fibronectin type III domain-containing protein [Bacteroidetes bacterium]|jgi:plastocyanin|nr:fibronectin type III domain-containing protein [Bacteroidota bacterium]MBK7568575.1 fibronectin type III domain-containing protein [Bacteroidota bacterium]
MKKIHLLLLLCFALSGTMQATIHIINVSNFVFTPNALTVNCNDTIQFHRVNGTHPVVSESGAWTTFTMSGALINQNIALSTAGTYAYYCDFHGGAGGVGMAGTITVTCAPPTCTTPGGVTSAMITSTTAKISWSAVVGATKYQIQYRPVGTPTWLKKNSTTLTKKLVGLTPSTTYQYKVKAICAVGSSPFSTIQTFTTLAFDDGGGDTKQEIAPVQEEHVTQMGVYPNPNSGEFQVVMMHVHQDGVKVQVYDMTGKLILEQPVTLMDMDFVENIKLPDGFKGNAIIKVTVDGKDYTKDILVQ